MQSRTSMQIPSSKGAPMRLKRNDFFGKFINQT